MTTKAFSKKEALTHGFNMAKKYIKVVLITMLIYFAYNVFNGLLTARAGERESHMDRTEVKQLYKDPAAAERFYEYLKTAGYVSPFGSRLERLQNLKSAEELVLAPELEGDREKIFRFLERYTYRLPFPKTVYYVLALAFWLIGVLMGVGLLKMSILLARDQEPELSELYSNGRLMLNYILGSFFYSLAVLGGFILLIVPGIILAVMLGMYPYIIVDQEMGPIQSLKASRALTKGVRGQLCLFGFMICLVNLGGLLCVFIGLVITIPVTYIASAYVYDQLIKAKEMAVQS